MPRAFQHQLEREAKSPKSRSGFTGGKEEGETGILGHLITFGVATGTSRWQGGTTAPFPHNQNQGRPDSAKKTVPSCVSNKHTNTYTQFYRVIVCHLENRSGKAQLGLHKATAEVDMKMPPQAAPEASPPHWKLFALLYRRQPPS